MKWFFVCILFLFPVVAKAEEQKLPPECRVLPDHKAAPGVAYESGVDVHGKAVVPADINASPVAMPENIVVPLSIDLARRLQGLNVTGLNLESTLGFLEVSKDGRVTYNGQDPTPQVYLLCGQKGAETPPETPIPDNGQKAPDALESAPVSSKTE